MRLAEDVRPGRMEAGMGMDERSAVSPAAEGKAPVRVEGLDNAVPFDESELLERLLIAFGVVGRLFWEDPDAGVLDDLLPMQAALGGEPFASMAPEGACMLAEVLAAYGADPAACMAQYRQDRAYLFYQVSYSRTIPYESVYRTEDRTLFGPTTAQVKREFARHGLALGTGRNEPSDHFGLECLFVSQVARAGLDALLVDDGATPDDAATPGGAAMAGGAMAAQGVVAAAGARVEAGRFMAEHLLVFAPIYLANVERRAKSGLYRAAAVLAREALAWAQRELDVRSVEALDPADFPI